MPRVAAAAAAPSMWRKKRTYRKKGYRRRPLYRPRGVVRRSYHAPKNFVETIKFADIISTPGTDPTTGTSLASLFLPQELPNLTSILSQLYSQFCIRGIKVMYIPSITEYSLAAGVIQMPKIYFAVDKFREFQDNASGNITRMMGQDNVKIFNPSRRWSAYIRMPRPLLSTTNEYQNDAPVKVQPTSKTVQWLPTTDFSDDGQNNSGLAVPHSAFRLITSSNNGSVNYTLGQLWFKVYYSVKEQTYVQPTPTPQEVV